MSEMPTRNTPTSGTPEWLRTVNDRVALRLLIDHGPLSRAQIKELSQVSKPTASQMVLRLERAGLIKPVGMTSGPRGRNAVMYDLRSDSITGVAMTVDANTIRAVVVDPTGAEHPFVSLSNEAHRGPSADVRAAVLAACEAAEVPSDRASHVVIGIQGAVHESEDMLDFLGTLPGWPNANVHQQLREETGLVVSIDNDANLSAVAEREAGTAADNQDFLFLWLGKGLGAGLDIDGKPRSGATGSAGEIGYLELPLSAAKIDPDAHDFTDLLGDDALYKMFATKNFDHALELFAEDQEAQEDYAMRLALLIKPLVAVLDPALVVLGGPTGNVGGQDLAEFVQERVGATPLVVTSVTGEDSVILGARSRLLRELRRELESRIENNV